MHGIEIKYLIDANSISTFVKSYKAVESEACVFQFVICLKKKTPKNLARLILDRRWGRLITRQIYLFIPFFNQSLGEKGFCKTETL